MKVYIVWETKYDETYIHGIYLDEELAKTKLNHQNHRAIEDREVDEY